LFYVCPQKINKSGLVSVQVIDKSYGQYRVVRTVGSSLENKEVDRLYAEGNQWVEERQAGPDLFEFCAKEKDRKLVVDALLSLLKIFY
jgi:hypothetical protein